MYKVHLLGSPPAAWAVRKDGAEETAGPVDYFRTRSAALHAAELLNRGLARVEHHRSLGCRVQPLCAVPAAVPSAAA